MTKQKPRTHALRTVQQAELQAVAGGKDKKEQQEFLIVKMQEVLIS
jgi:hypothetical protein